MNKANFPMDVTADGKRGEESSEAPLDAMRTNTTTPGATVAAKLGAVGGKPSVARDAGGSAEA